ncbi:acylphosphatase [Gryllotalpicola protaetiae]|uniref:Acylphosphatase n=1 Tax=Gryllotalpicola protaetiae TaxID=2419771 RepID=A0A387BST5_9MICO|nr:acylphosphatase [Gryllotalpicola protaetiae]AYG04119.1 acylphosphatase [Gryllotalpicola protaetiae]
MRRVRAVISGDVQGVGFRYSARERARRLGVAGWVRNLPDGSVEAEVEGEAGAVERMLAWLDRGPSGARVASVAVTETPVLHAAEFTIER